MHFRFLKAIEGREAETVPSSTSNLGTPHRHQNLHGKRLGNLILLRGNSLELRVHQPSGKKSEAPSPHPRRGCKFIHPSPFPERFWNCRFPKKRSYSGFEEDVSFIRDRFTTRVKADSNTTLEGHVVDVRKALVEYREASSRRDDTPAQEYCFDRSVPNRSSVQRRLSIYSWNTGCAVLFNKDTFFPDVKVKSIYLHDTRRELPGEVMEGDSGWVLQGVLSRVSFRRRPLSDQKHIHSYVVAHQ